jgi:hypothetical protein
MFCFWTARSVTVLQYISQSLNGVSQPYVQLTYYFHKRPLNVFEDEVIIFSKEFSHSKINAQIKKPQKYRISR